MSAGIACWKQALRPEVLLQMEGAVAGLYGVPMVADGWQLAAAASCQATVGVLALAIAVEALSWVEWWQRPRNQRQQLFLV